MSEREMDEKNIQAILEGVLFAMGDSVDPDVMAKALGIEKKEVIRQLQSMQQTWEEQQRGIRLTEIDGSYQMCTAPEVYEYLIRIAKQPKKYVLTEVLMETLSIIAYKQPVTKLEIEKIRGVKSDHAVNRLVEYNLVYEVGRMDAPGRPALFATTEEFLRRFGVGGLSDLPHMNPEQEEEIKAEVEEELQMKLEELPGSGPGSEEADGEAP